MKLRLMLLVAVAALALGKPTLAHHSFAAEFDGSKPIRLVGKITRIEWTNPHSYIYVDVNDDQGHATNWACEGASPLALTRRGWKRVDLKLGDTIVVDGYRARDGSHFMNARRVTFPDGRSLDSGSKAPDAPPDSTPAK
jgi:hypothetical protein